MTRFFPGRRRFDALLSGTCAALLPPLSAGNAAPTADLERLKATAVQAAAVLHQHIASGTCQERSEMGALSIRPALAVVNLT
jgi:hypothetical protein